MDGWESRFVYSFSGSHQAFRYFSLPCRISTGKECNVSLISSIPPLYLSLFLPLSTDYGVVWKEEMLPGFALHPPSFHVISSVYRPLLGLCFSPFFFVILPYSCCSLPQNGNTFLKDGYRWRPFFFFLTIDGSPSRFFPCWCYIHYIMALTFGLVKVMVHKLSALASH